MTIVEHTFCNGDFWVKDLSARESLFHAGGL